MQERSQIRKGHVARRQSIRMTRAHTLADFRENRG
jgi:hypothetical protein